MAAAPVRVGGRFRFHRKTPVAYDRVASLELNRPHQRNAIVRCCLTALLDFVVDVPEDITRLIRDRAVIIYLRPKAAISRNSQSGAFNSR